MIFIKTKPGNRLSFMGDTKATVLCNDGYTVRIDYDAGPCGDLSAVASYRPWQIERDIRWQVIS